MENQPSALIVYLANEHLSTGTEMHMHRNTGERGIKTRITSCLPGERDKLAGIVGLIESARFNVVYIDGLLATQYEGFRRVLKEEIPEENIPLLVAYLMCESDPKLEVSGCDFGIKRRAITIKRSFAEISRELPGLTRCLIHQPPMNYKGLCLTYNRQRYRKEKNVYIRI